MHKMKCVNIPLPKDETSWQVATVRWNILAAKDQIEYAQNEMCIDPPTER